MISSLETDKLLTFLVGAGSAGTIVGSLILYRVKKSWDSLDRLPELIKAVETMKTTVDSFSGKLDVMKDNIHTNNKEIAVVEQKATAAFEKIDWLRENAKM